MYLFDCPRTIKHSSDPHATGAALAANAMRGRLSVFLGDSCSSLVVLDSGLDSG